MTTRIESRTLNATVRDPRLEAQRVVGPGFAARVLEPSPPAILDGEWLADDPTVGDEPTPEQPVLSPAPGRGHTWEEWLRGHPDQGGWAGARWLAGYRRLSSPPSALPQTRLALHRLAVYVVSPARRHANGKIGLRWTLGGFGTPFFGPDEQVRVDGTWIVRQQSDRASAERITSLAKAASFALDAPPDAAWASDFDVPSMGDPDEPLGVDPDAAAYLGDWYGFTFSVLEELRAAPASVGRLARPALAGTLRCRVRLPPRR